MPQVSRKIPYLDTEITAAQSRIDIENLLNEFGIKDTRWTHLEGDTVLEFIWHFEEKGVKKSVAFKLKPPVIQVRGKAKREIIGGKVRWTGPLVWKRAENAEWRLMWWWLKSKLEAVRYGLETMEQALMSQVMVPLPNGRVTTIGEILSEAIKNDVVQALRELPGTVDIIPVSEQKKLPRIIEVSESGEINDAHES